MNRPSLENTNTQPDTGNTADSSTQKSTGLSIALLSNELNRTAGEGRVLEALLTRLVERGYRLEFFTSYDNSALSQHPNVRLHRVPVLRWKDLTNTLQYSLLAPFVYRRFARKNRVDLVFGNGLNIYLKQDLNLCHFCHSTWLKVERRLEPGGRFNLKKSILHGFERYFAWVERKRLPRLAKEVLVCSDLMKTGLVNDAQLPTGQVKVLSYGVDLAVFQPVASPETKKERQAAFGLPVGEDKIFLLFIGDLKSRRKGLPSLLEALGQLKADLRLHLVVAGSTRGNIFEETVRALGLEERISFIGHQDDISRVYHACDLLVFPSFYDPGPLVVLEALACGLPVICTATCGVSTAISQGEDGLVIPDAEDVAALREALVTLTTDRARLVEAGQKAYHKAQEYSWDKATDRLEAAISSAVEARKANANSSH